MFNNTVLKYAQYPQQIFKIENVLKNMKKLEKSVNFKYW